MKSTSIIRIVLSVMASCLIFSAHAQTQLWGTATSGGYGGSGTIVQGDSDGSHFHTVCSFVDAIGAYPVGKMAMANNKLYVVTEYGGYGNSCTICSFDPGTGTLTNVYNFDSLSQYGDVPTTGLIMASNGLLYGTTSSGGANGYGVIYSFNPSGNVYTDLYDFSESSGAAPAMELLQANDGKLYGITVSASDSLGAIGGGSLFSFDPATDNFVELYTFPLAYGASSANSPALIQASDNNIYGLVNNQSNNYYGIYNLDSTILFSYNIASATCSILQYLNDSAIGIPESGLIQTADGKLYGTTNGGGYDSYYGSGNAFIYSYDIATGSFNTVLPLDVNTGLSPEANMGMLSNGQLVFSTTDGGAYQQGALVSFDINSGTYNVMFSFDGTTGSAPQCDIMQAPGTAVYTASLISVYPNPTPDIVNLYGLGPGAAYTITDMMGKIHMQGTVSPAGIQAIDLSPLPEGMYLINQMKVVKE